MCVCVCVCVCVCIYLTYKSVVSVKAGNKKVVKFVSSCLTELPAHFSFSRMSAVNKLREAIFDSDDEFS